MDGVHPDLVIGPSTEMLAGNGKILTAGAIDCHVHLICPQILDEALATGITTIIGGGTGPAEGTKATTVTAAPWYLAPMLTSIDGWPINVVLLGKGNTVSADAMWEQLRAGASGFKLHEDWGSTPAAIDACLRVCDEAGVQASLHTDTLNEAGFVETTLAAIAGRSIHAYHTEGAGGGHAPDIITVAGVPNVLPSSTNPTRPHTVNTVDEHLDMLMVCHHLNPSVPEDLAFAESRIRPSTIAAEDVLHDLGAISMIGSDSQAMGRDRRGGHPHLADRARHEAAARVAARATVGADNERAKRYVAKYTICPAIAHGLERRDRLDRARQARRPRALRPPVLRRAPARRRQGRGDRVGRDGRRQRVHPHAPAGAPPPDVRRRSAAPPATRRSRSCRRPRSTTGWPTGSSCRTGLVAVDDCRGVTKADMVNNDALPRDHRRPRHVHGHRRRRRHRAGPGPRAPDGPALLPVLMAARSRSHRSCGRRSDPRSSLADGRFPDGAPRAQPRARGRGRRRSRPRHRRSAAPTT